MLLALLPGSLMSFDISIGMLGLFHKQKKEV